MNLHVMRRDHRMPISGLKGWRVGATNNISPFDPVSLVSWQWCYNLHSCPFSDVVKSHPPISPIHCSQHSFEAKNYNFHSLFEVLPFACKLMCMSPRPKWASKNHHTRAYHTLRANERRIVGVGNGHKKYWDDQDGINTSNIRSGKHKWENWEKRDWDG